jgi:hypothetical protein
MRRARCSRVPRLDRQYRCRAHPHAGRALPLHQGRRPSQGLHGLPPADPSREAEQIARLRRLADEANLDPDFAEKFLNFIIREVIRHHEAIAAENGASQKQ